MTEFLSVNRQEFFNEAVTRGRAQGVVNQEAYNGLVEEIIEEHRSVGEIHDDDRTEGFEDYLRARWPDYREELGLDSKAPQI